MQWLLLLSFCLCIIMIYSFKISPKWYNFVFSRQNYTENRWRCIGRIWLGILKKYFAWKLCIMKVCYGPNISSVWKSSMWTILHGFLADLLLSQSARKPCKIQKIVQMDGQHYSSWYIFSISKDQLKLKNPS